MTETPKVTQEFLDSSQYEESSILQYESIYGADFVSPGGRELAFEMIATMDLAAASRVLDVGCGLGGSAFVMASEFGLRVDGIDLSRNMLALAEQKLATNGLSNLVRLRWGDCLELDACEQYDAIYSRDVFLHIADKARLFERLHLGNTLIRFLPPASSRSAQVTRRRDLLRSCRPNRIVLAICRCRQPSATT